MSAHRKALAAVVVLAMSGSLAVHAAGLQPPAGYGAAIGHKSGSAECLSPAPYTATLDFPSKYEGSGKARDQLNEAADAEYKARSKPVTDMEKGMVKLVDKYVETGQSETLKCIVDAYLSWSRAGALKQSATGHTGRSVRKWALASLSSAWLKLEFSSSQPLKAYPEQTVAIEQWLGSIADQVVGEWDEKAPIERINNHFYWAAWAVMATSVVTDRRDLFDWSVKMYGIFAGQVDDSGYLKNELNRETRALGYHNYALTPVVMMAAFGKANGVDLAAQGNGALKRLAEVTLKGIDNPKLFEDRVGKHQDLEGFDEPQAKLSWLEPYCWTVSCTGTAAQKLSSLRPMKNQRLGGDMTQVFAERR